MLVGNQVSGQPFSLTTADIGAPSASSITTTWTGSTNTMPAACRQAYTSSSLNSLLPNSGTSNASVGIDTNNACTYCSMRFGMGVEPGYNTGAYDCLMGQMTTIQLWVK